MATPFPFTSGQTLLASQLNAITTLPSTTKVASHTLVIADQGTRVVMNSASVTSVTVNTSIFGAGDIVEIQNIGAGVCTVTAGTATVSSAGPLAIPQFGGGQLFFTSAGVSIFFPTAVTTSASGVVQVKSTTKLDTFTSSSSSYTDVTGLAQSITPTSASNKVLIVVTMTLSADVAQGFLRLVRDSTVIGVGTAAGNRTQATTGFVVTDVNIAVPLSMSFLDSPASTSATNYKVQINSPGSAALVVNSTQSDADLASKLRAISAITVFEVTP